MLVFAPKFKYILGQLNTVTGGLSRAHEKREKTPSTHSFCFSCEVVDLGLEIVKFKQKRDDDIQVIARDLLDDEYSSPGFTLINGILYQMSLDENECS